VLEEDAMRFPQLVLSCAPALAVYDDISLEERGSATRLVDVP
jgi:hypothetical protein